MKDKPYKTPKSVEKNSKKKELREDKNTCSLRRVEQKKLRRSNDFTAKSLYPCDNT